MFSTKNEEKKVKLRVEYSSENTGDKRFFMILVCERFLGDRSWEIQQFENFMNF